jgi:phosphoribosylamine--glycine ligase
MKFIMCSNCGEGAAILYHIMLEGNDVALWIKEKSYAQAWDGLLPKVKKPTPEKDDVVIFDFSGMGELADKFRKAGHHVLGGSAYSDKLEQDRMFGLEAMEAAGIKIPLTKEFDDFSIKLVQDFLKEYGGDGKRWVFKPSGTGPASSLTYVSEDDDDLMFWVEYVEKGFSKDVDSFVLQQFIEGVVVSTEVWGNGNKFVLGTLNHDLEVKKFMNHCLGPATGCSGNVIWSEKDPRCRIATEGVLRMEAAAMREQFCGPLDLNVVANEQGIWALEFCARFGFEGVTNLPLLIKDDVGKFFSDIAYGQGDNIELNNGFASGVRLTIPPYPVEADVKDAEKVTPNVGVPIRGLPENPEEVLKHFHFYEVFDDGDGVLRHSPGTGVIACVRDLNDDLEAAFDRPYELLEDIVLPNKQYRTDLAEVLGEMHDEVVAQENTWTNGSSQ